MERTIGEIKQSSSSFEWKIKNFISLSAEPDDRYESSPFYFYNASWCLVIYPFGGADKDANYISLYLKKLNYHELNHTISLKLSIKNYDGTDCNRCEIYNSEYYKNKISWGYAKFLDRSDVVKVTHPDGVLTFSCAVNWDNSVYNAASAAVSTKNSEKPFLDMETVFPTGQDRDVTLVVQDRKYAVHRIVLIIRSPVFAAMFRNNTNEKTSGIVNIADFDPGVFHEYLLYLYTSKVEISSKTAVSIYSVADKYDTQELKTKCVEFMKDNMSLDIFCSVVSLALQHEEQSLLEAATKFFVKNFQQIIVTVKWQALMKENPATANELLVQASKFYVLPKE